MKENFDTNHVLKDVLINFSRLIVITIDEVFNFFYILEFNGHAGIFITAYNGNWRFSQFTWRRMWRSTYRAQEEFCWCVFRRLTFYTTFSRATKWRSKSSFREFSFGARIIKRGRIFAQRFTVAGEYECISKNCLRASRSPCESRTRHILLCADDVGVATAENNISAAWEQRWNCHPLVSLLQKYKNYHQFSWSCKFRTFS